MEYNEQISIDPLKTRQGAQHSMQLQTARKGRRTNGPSEKGKFSFSRTVPFVATKYNTYKFNKSIFTCGLACLVLCVHLLFMGAGVCPAEAQEASSQPGQEAWSIDADRIEYDQKQDQYTAAGNVIIEREGRKLTADHVQFSQKTREAVAQGNVRLESGKDRLSGEHLQLNMDTEIGTLTNGTLFISENHLYLSGRKIKKTGLQTYTAEKVRITSCDGLDPDWEITGRDLKVTIEGYGYAKHTALWAGSVPVLYSPILAFPVKLNRQSGLLAPQIGRSDRKGNQYVQPLYWAINDHSDATLYSHYMSSRGLRTGLEYRYVIDDSTLGAFMGEGFKDFRIDDGQGDASDRWGYSDDTHLRINEDRYWIRMKHDQGFKSGVTGKLDIDVVSDQDYLHEFRSGYNGFNQTQDYFLETFGRDIDDYNEAVRLNRLNINRTWEHYSLNADLRWYDDVVKRRITGTDDTVQQLPVISFEGLKQALGDSPFYFDLAGTYAHLYRINGTRGHRADLYPRIYYPTTLWQVLSIEPSAGVRQTTWQVDHYETVPDHGRRTHYRAIYDVKLDMSTEIYNVFDSSWGGIDRIKHAVTPEITYEFIPDDDQSDFPQFDALDRIERKNLITYGFTNNFTSRTRTGSNGTSPQYAYNPFLRFKLSQSFDINKDREGDPRPFSAINAELDLNPGGGYVALDSDAKWSPYDGGLESFNSILSLRDLRGDKLTADYRYTRDIDSDGNPQDGIESIRVAAEAVLSNKWRLRAGYEYNFYTNTRNESNAGISYQSQCWGVDVDYLSEQNNERYVIMFHLSGMGSLGSGLNN